MLFCAYSNIFSRPQVDQWLPAEYSLVRGSITVQLTSCKTGLGSTKHVNLFEHIWNSVATNWPIITSRIDNLLLDLRSCTADLLLDWFGFSQTRKFKVNSTSAKQVKMLVVQWYFPLQSEWVFSGLVLLIAGRKHSNHGQAKEKVFNSHPPHYILKNILTYTTTLIMPGLLPLFDPRHGQKHFSVKVWMGKGRKAK